MSEEFVMIRQNSAYFSRREESAFDPEEAEEEENAHLRQIELEMVAVPGKRRSTIGLIPRKASDMADLALDSISHALHSQQSRTKKEIHHVKESIKERLTLHTVIHQYKKAEPTPEGMHSGNPLFNQD
jgi:hypothetical protein